MSIDCQHGIAMCDLYLWNCHAMGNRIGLLLNQRGGAYISWLHIH